eukprot:TRINITY_DN80093_c0_g1_i1.p1 TRINITY_DN80093_c0_g1~~TRINITY_DN80093_c0_g1_i1.p1  ORF type:complete len:203 (+),score=19.51 TRINITY_DN80093_c0_g1_i1:104-712(+)
MALFSSYKFLAIVVALSMSSTIAAEECSNGQDCAAEISAMLQVKKAKINSTKDLSLEESNSTSSGHWVDWSAKVSCQNCNQISLSKCTGNCPTCGVHHSFEVNVPYRCQRDWNSPGETCHMRYAGKKTPYVRAGEALPGSGIEPWQGLEKCLGIATWWLKKHSRGEDEIGTVQNAGNLCYYYSKIKGDLGCTAREAWTVRSV